MSETAAEVILCDTSSSMAGKRVERLRAETAKLSVEYPAARWFAFSSGVTPIEGPANLPSPGGGTAMHKALRIAADLRAGHVIVVSDGYPDDDDAALAEAENIPGMIEVLFVGDDNDRPGIDFMHRLARIGGGRVVVHDLLKNRALLAPVLREMLALPAPIAL
jgi:Mg-chelatase subunit ChlD